MKTSTYSHGNLITHSLNNNFMVVEDLSSSKEYTFRIDYDEKVLYQKSPALRQNEIRPYDTSGEWNNPGTSAQKHAIDVIANQNVGGSKKAEFSISPEA